MAILRMDLGATWPGQLHPSSDTPSVWDKLRKKLDELYVGGPSLTVAFDDYDDVEKAQATVSSYGRKQNCFTSGWRYQTTRRAKTLYVHKVTYSGKAKK